MIAKFIVKSCLHFAIKIILAASPPLRSSQSCKAATVVTDKTSKFIYEI